MALALLAGIHAADAKDEGPRYSPVAISGQFVEKNDGTQDDRAGDLSGIACRLRNDRAMQCLVVNDESTFAQWATLRDGQLTAERAVVSTDGPSGGGSTAGSPDAVGSCPAEDPSPATEFDGEGVAWAPRDVTGGTFYIVGSHSCSRSQKKPTRPRTSTHRLARVEVDLPGASQPRVSISWRLGPSLRARAELQAHYNKLPWPGPDHNGLDIEGIAAVEQDLFFGLRAPTIDDRVFLVRAPASSVAALFETSRPADEPVPLQLAPVRLGASMGIRDLAALPDGRVLVLSGPSHEQDGGPFLLHTVPRPNEIHWDDPSQAIAPVLQTEIDLPRPEAKVEGINVQGVEQGTLRVLLLFEKPRRDGARELWVRLRPN